MKKIIIILVLIGVITISSSLNFGSSKSSGNYFLRSIDTNELRFNSAQEVTEALEDSMFSYEYNTSENNIDFTSIEYIPEQEYYKIQEFNTISENLKQVIYASYDLENNLYKFSLELFDSNDMLVYQGYEEYTPIFEVVDGVQKIYLEVDGELISIDTAFASDSIDNLDFLTLANPDYILVGGAAVVMAVIIIPQILDEVTTVTTSVTEKIVSILTGWYTTITSTFTSTVTIQTYAISVDGELYDMIIVDAEVLESLDKSEIFLALADSDTGYLWISKVAITEAVAATAIRTSDYVMSFGGSKKLYTSTYTFEYNTAERIARLAFGNTPTLTDCHNMTAGSGYYNHFHGIQDNGDQGRGHSFYGHPY
ncbi:MAG: hypothetical protein QM489_02815 [Candidatus Izemoplasma sp.]